VTTEPIVLEINDKIVNGSIHSLVENNPLTQQNDTNHKRKTNIFKDDNQSITLGTDL
jgi:hypothetical protein